MTSALNLDFSGDKALLHSIKQLKYRVAKSLLSNATRAGAIIVRRHARTYVPKLSGRLRKATVYKRTVRRQNLVRFSIGFGKLAYYGKPLEIGGFYKVSGGGVRYQPAHPMLRPAIYNHKREVYEKMRTIFWRGIAREAMRHR